MATHPIYQFYAELDDYKSKIWRRFQVTDNISPARLCYIIQVLFEITASHLMALEAPLVGQDVTLRFEIMDEDCNDFPPHRNVQIHDAAFGNLRRIGLKTGSKLNFNYDFGDSWWVSLTLEEIFEDKDLPGEELPRVIDGAGFGIVEDVGGVGGLEDLAKAFKKKKGADYKQFSKWLGVDDLDMTAFDLDDMNFRLKKIPRIYKQCYEDGLMPTQRSIDLIERKYLRKKP
ncbi:MAG: plasmid pRiA4b ORF-3 family protein [Sporomusa sp.]